MSHRQPQWSLQLVYQDGVSFVAILIVNHNKLVISAQQICHFNIKVMLKYN